MVTTRGRRVAGSGVAHPLDATPIGAVEPDLPMQITVVLRPRDRRAHVAGPAMHPADRPILSADDLAAWYDPGNERIDLVTKFAGEFELSVGEISRARHDVVLDGTARQFSRAFGVTLQWFEAHGSRYYAYDRGVRLPRDLRAAAEGVLGLENIPTHRTHAAAAKRDAHAGIPTLERQYGFPRVDARGQRIALLEFGGGFTSTDLTAYAREHGIAEPRVTPVPIRGATGEVADNSPLDGAKAAAIARDWNAAVPFATLAKKYGLQDIGAFVASLEVTMDIELALALGGGAAVDVYFAPSGVDGWRRGLFAAIGLPVGGSVGTKLPAPTVISISWGESEAVFGPSSLQMIEHTLIAARRAGVAICCSSGDRGSVNTPVQPGVKSIPNVNFPASSPSVLACGGTRMLAPNDANATREEVAWNERAFGGSVATGGGVSGYFRRQKAQANVHVHPAKGTWRAANRGDSAMRGVPDVAANAALSSGPSITLAGTQVVGFGTSAAAPICASLLTRVSAAVGHSVAGLEGWLYTPDAKPCYKPVTQGDNDVTNGKVAFYRAGPGWNACTGLGTLQGDALVATLIKTRRT